MSENVATLADRIEKIKRIEDPSFRSQLKSTVILTVLY